MSPLEQFKNSPEYANGRIEEVRLVSGFLFRVHRAITFNEWLLMVR